MGRAVRLRLPGPLSPAWVLAESAVAAAFSLLSVLAIARVIGPHEAGLGAVAIAAFLLLDVLGASLFSDALIQRPRLEARHARSALTGAALAGCGTAALLAASAPLLEAAAGAPGLSPLLLALAPLLPLSALAGAGYGLLARAQRFRLLALRVLLGQPLALGAGLAAGLAGWGAWAMVAAQAGATLSALLVVFAGGRIRHRPGLDAGAIRDLSAVALPQIGAVALIVGRYRLFLVVLGILVAEAVLALANLAFRMVEGVLSMAHHAVTRIALPRLCAVQADRAALARCYGEVAQLQALIGLPLALGLALVAGDLAPLLLGPGWEGVAGAARIAGLAAALSYLHGNQVALFVALGRARRNLAIAAAELLVPLLALLLLRPATAEGIALAWGSAHLLVTPVVAWIVLREIGRGPGWLLRQVRPALVAAAGMAAAVAAVQAALAAEPPVLRLAASVALGALAYLGLAWLMLGRRGPGALAPQAEAAGGMREAAGRA